jgi:hypothetical protein
MNGLPLWQLIGVLAVPTFGVFLGILLNQRGNDRLAERVDRLSDRLDPGWNASKRNNVPFVNKCTTNTSLY